MMWRWPFASESSRAKWTLNALKVVCPSPSAGSWRCTCSWRAVGWPAVEWPKVDSVSIKYSVLLLEEYMSMLGE